MRALLLSLLLAFAVTGLCLETRLMTPAELRKRVLLTPVSDFAKLPIFVHTPDFVLASSKVGPLFSLRAQDKTGRHWRVVLRDAVRGAWQSGAQPQRTYYLPGTLAPLGAAPLHGFLSCLSMNAVNLFRFSALSENVKASAF